MNKIIVLFILFTSLTSPVSAQMRKIDEFGKIYSHDIEMRMYYFGAEIFNDPKSVGQILVYRGEKDTLGFPYKIGAAIISFLTIKSAIEKSRIIITCCKAEQNTRIELWKVPKLEELKTCENESLNLPKTILFDSVYYNPEWDSCCLIDAFDEEQYEASLKAFANLLKNNSNSKAYLFFYLGTNVYYDLDGRKVRKLDSPKLIKELVKTAKKIMSENGVESSRTVLINGGYKDSSRNIELWYVPTGEKPPKPKPNFFPKSK